MSQVTLPEQARYTFGGDEFLFVEIDEAMSLEANIRAVEIAQAIQQSDTDGITELCPANASLLIRFNPEVIHPKALQEIVEEIERQTKNTPPPTIRTRIIDVPVWYGDPYTTAVMKRFREGFHQDPGATDLEYAARVNNCADTEEFVERHQSQPWLVSMVGFVAGLPFTYQLVPREKQLEVPKYLSPRSGGTPELTLGHGGCFGATYSVEGAGGYQMLGLLAGPIFDSKQSLPDFADSMFFFRPGDIVKYRAIEEEEYRNLREQVAAGTFSYRTVPVTFEAEQALADIERYNRVLMEALNGA